MVNSAGATAPPRPRAARAAAPRHRLEAQQPVAVAVDLSTSTAVHRRHAQQRRRRRCSVVAQPGRPLPARWPRGVALTRHHETKKRDRTEPAADSLPPAVARRMSRRRFIAGAAARWPAPRRWPATCRRALGRGGRGRDPAPVRPVPGQARRVRDAGEPPFDHYFGTFPGVRGFSDPHAIRLPNGRLGVPAARPGQPRRLPRAVPHGHHHHRRGRRPVAQPRLARPARLVEQRRDGRLAAHPPRVRRRGQRPLHDGLLTPGRTSRSTGRWPSRSPSWTTTTARSWARPTRTGWCG